MTTEVRTPFATSTVELSDGGLWRKQILKFDTIDYVDAKTGERRKLTFDRKYGEDLIAAFRAGAYPQVPFQIADAQNRHNNDPRNTGGEVVGVTLSRDGSGVDGFLRTWGDGTRVVEQNPKIGVSARILENLATPDGRQFPRAVQHVLATVDPQMRDMHPWEKVSSVDLSSGTVTEAVDLSAATYERKAAMPELVTEEGKPIELSTAQAERLRTILDDEDALEALAEQLGPDFLAAFNETEDDDEDDTVVDSVDDEDDDDEEDDVQLSGVNSEALELARAQLDSQGAQLIELTNQLNLSRTQAEVAELSRQGLAPAVLNAARPLLAVESGAVELSNGVPGQAVDPGEIIREVLATVIDLANSGHLLVDPDSEEGSLEGARDARAGNRAALLADWETYN